jgi:hypothetical protein
MCRRYIPKTNCLFEAITRTNHSPSGGNVTGKVARRPPALDRMLTNRTKSGRDGSVPNGFSVSRRIRLRPSQNTTSASNGSFRSNSARNSPRDPGFRTMNVPAAPTLMTSYSLNSLARMLGRNVLWPPTLTPLRKTIRAIPCHRVDMVAFKLAVKLSSQSQREATMGLGSTARCIAHAGRICDWNFRIILPRRRRTGSETPVSLQQAEMRPRRSCEPVHAGAHR